LKARGGDLVVVDTPEGLNLVKAALGTAAPRLAIDTANNALGSLATLTSRTSERPCGCRSTNQ
jgi:hypothetical protein